MYLGLQVGRGIAALLVLLLHSSWGGGIFYEGDAFGGFWEFGSIGVDFFFVLSGFIIYWVHSSDGNGIASAGLYMKKRLIRIYPPFILISLILLIAYSGLPSLSIAGREIGVITSLLLIPTPPLHPALAVSWTLMHEMLFYSIFLLLYFNRTILYAALVLWTALIIIVNLTSEGEGLIYTFFLNPHNIHFLFGIIAAMLVKQKKHTQTYILIGLIMFSAYIISFQYDIHSAFEILPTKIYLGFCFMCIVIGLCAIEKKISYPKFLIFLGAASYSIYLIHYPIISISNRIAEKINLYIPLAPEVFFMLATTLGLLSGILYYLLWEKPSLQFLKRKYFPKKTP